MPYNPILTPEQYYNDDANIGGYQYVTLREVIDSVLLDSMDDDSYLKNTKRSKILMKAYQGIRKLTWDASKDVYMVEMTVGTDLFLPLPQFYVDWKRISVMIDGKLMPLNSNKSISHATGYLQDSDALIIFDDDGKIITTDANNAYNKPYNKYEFCSDPQGGHFETDTSKLSQYGEVNIDEQRGYMLFSSNLVDQSIVLEYLSDGLHMENMADDEIKIHKFLEEPLTDWIYYACIAQKRNVPSNEKQRALLRYKTTAHKAKKQRSDIDLNEISRLVGLGSKML